MIINLEELNTGTWFPWKDGAEVCVRVCAGDDFADLKSKSVKIRSEVVWDPRTRQPQKVREEIRDDRVYTSLLWDYCIVDWRNILDAKEQPIPCTKEMKLLLMNSAKSGFPTFISECLDTLNGVEEKDREESEKN